MNTRFQTINLVAAFLFVIVNLTFIQSTLAGNLIDRKISDVSDASDNLKSSKHLQGNQESGFYPPKKPLISFSRIDREKVKWQSTTRFANLSPSRAPGDCEVDFNDPAALSLLDNAAEHTFATDPWWNQQCDIDNNVFIRPYNIDHFHLNFENATCYDVGLSGELQNDGSCKIFSDPEQQPRVLHTMLANDVIELIVNDSNGNQVLFDFKRIRIAGNNPVRVCYKPEHESDGPWITQAIDELTEPGLWACWNNMTTGYWDVSEWAGNVTAVRLIGEGIPNFMVDDIRIGIN